MDSNQQILDVWNHANLDKRGDSTRAVMEESMESLKFGYPVRNTEELHEVSKLCLFYHIVTHNSESILREFRQVAKTLDVSLSLTDRCGNFCRHCSTNATLAKDKTNVPFEVLEKALVEMSPYVSTLAISCEGDPFYYESSVASSNGESSKKNIVDVTELLIKNRFDNISIQSMAPNEDRRYMLKKMLKTTDQEHGEDFRFLSQISFNLYSPRAGLKTRLRVDDNGPGYKESYVPLVEKSRALDWMIQSMRKSKNNMIGTNACDRRLGEEAPELQETANKLRQYANDMKQTILEYARRGYEIHFELRGDMGGGITNLTNTESVLTEILDELSEEHPEIPFPKCPACSKIHFDRKFALIVPLGRAANLFPNGRKEERAFFDKHVKMNPYKYLCDNWLSWGSMIFDTRGFPQLCYSNVALTPRARTTQGPNLYHDEFENLHKFYIRVWEDRIEFLKNNLTRLIRFRPNENYCPLELFKQTLTKFNQRARLLRLNVRYETK